jgi:REP element-mobilizing transposase RayT
MSLFRGRYRIESARHPFHTYTHGCYFVTIVTHQRQPLFGRIEQGVIHPSPAGCVVADEWQRTTIVRPYIELDEWIVMPDHIHAIIFIHPHDHTIATTSAVETPRRGVSTTSHAPDGAPHPLHAPDGAPHPPHAPDGAPHDPRSRWRSGSLGAIIGQFKSVSTKRLIAMGYSSPIWQTRFYDRIIYDDDALQRTRRYIHNNPYRHR